MESDDGDKGEEEEVTGGRGRCRLALNLYLTIWPPYALFEESFSRGLLADMVCDSKRLWLCLWWVMR